MKALNFKKYCGPIHTFLTKISSGNLTLFILQMWFDVFNKTKAISSSLNFICFYTIKKLDKLVRLERKTDREREREN